MYFSLLGKLFAVASNLSQAILASKEVKFKVGNNFSNQTRKVLFVFVKGISFSLTVEPLLL